ncbi:MAG: hypothetical protein GX451_10450 [Acholeplasmataceae bacterium]|nr:hypothetical protein [Acholeplasmataceae bacterium]
MKVIKIFLLVCFAIILQACSSSQPKSHENTKEPVKVYSNWQRVTVPNVGTFSIPPALEVRDFDSDITNEVKSNSDVISYIQAGTKGFMTTLEYKYTRVSLITLPLSKGDGPLLTLLTPLNIANVDLKGFDEGTQKALQENYAKYGELNYRWWPSKIIHVNGVDCIYTHFVRNIPSLRTPPAEEHWYTFFNKGKMHVLKVAYWERDANYWAQGENNLMNIVQTLDLINQS